MTSRKLLPFAIAATAFPLLTGGPAIGQADAQAPVDSQPIPVPAAPAPGKAPAAAMQPAPANGAAMQPAPVDASPAPLPPLGGDTGVAARDAHTLNPVLNPTDTELKSGLAAGRSLGETKQDLIDLFGPSRRGFQFRQGGIFGEKRRETGAVIWVTPVTEARWRGLLEQRAFADAQQQQADFNSLQQLVVAPQRTLTFIVELGDLVEVKKHDPPATQAQADDALSRLSGIRFVLSDDKGINYNPRDVIVPMHTETRQAFYDSIAAAPDRVPGLSTGAPAQVSPLRVMMRRSPYSDFAAFYTVTFDAYNPDGTARINRDTRTITLRIITPDDAKYAVFELNKIP